MAKKSARKEITKINLKQAALEGLSYERACETAKRAGKPSYRFTVGDKVQVGHLLNCVVDEALEGGYMYLIRSGANSDNYSCWAWTNVRPLDDDKDTHFAKRNSALSRLHYSNRSMYSLLSFQYLFGVDFNPDYQRGSVWDDEDREKLLDSIFMGREIGRFVFKQLPFTRTSNDGNYYEIVDGKQRMLTLLAFYENRFPYKGVFYNDLSAQDKNWFMDASIGVAEIDQSVTRAEVLEIFLAMNEGGQFFTPYNVGQMMARINMPDSLVLDKSRILRVNDPCCGAGCLLLAGYNVMREQLESTDPDWDKYVLFVAQDIDPLVCKMCYIQMCCIGVPGVVVVGNSLFPDTELSPTDFWFTHKYFALDEKALENTYQQKKE